MKDEIYNEWLKQIQKEWYENVILQKRRYDTDQVMRRREYQKRRWRDTMNDKVYEILKPIREDVINILEESNYPKSIKVIIHKLEKMNVITKEDNISHLLSLWLNSDPMFKRIPAGKRKYHYMLKSKEVE